MATSPLDPANVSVRADRRLGRGHDTRDLGPSDSSDSGSDLVGAAGEGDDELDSDSDRAGTGERASAARDSVAPDGADVAPDRVEKVEEEDEADEGGKPRSR